MNNSFPQHAALESLDVKDGCLQIGGMSLTRLVQRVGTTPFYAYDRKKISERVALLRRYMPPEIQLYYAMKANPMPAVVQHLAKLVDGMDVASMGEMKVALDTPLTSHRISFSGPGKRLEELRSAVASDVVINVESASEMERVVQCGEELGMLPRVSIRVNPDFELQSSGMKMGGGAKPFGIDAEQVPSLLQRISTLGLNFVGLHVFSGSQNLNTSAICEAQEKTIRLAKKIAHQAGVAIPWLNIGGGLGVPYFPGQQHLDLAVVGERLHGLVHDIKQIFPNIEIAMELGRYIVAEAGIYVCRVVERKTSRGQIFLVTDGGMHHHLAASGNLGQVIRKNFPVLIGNKIHQNADDVVTIVGPLCTPLDILAEQIPVTRASIGDLVVVLQSGAYGLTASPVTFLNHPEPIEVLV